MISGIENNCFITRSVLILLIILIYMIIRPFPLKSDTLIMNNGTLLVGKVKSESVSNIVFKNTYGAFTVKRSDISALYITKSYEEDIGVRKKLGMDFDPEEIRKNYTAGQRDLTEKEKTLIVKEKTPAAETSETAELKISVKFFIDGFRLAVTGELREPIPYGYGGSAGFETGENYMENTTRNFLIPWFRVEGGYLMFDGDESLLEGFTSGAGALWLFPVSADCRSNIRLAVEPGISSFHVEHGSETASTVTFTLHSILGYEYSFDYVSVFINFRYMYVYDKDVIFNSAGLSAGVSGKLW